MKPSIRIAAVATVLTMALAVAGCDGGTPGATTPPSPQKTSASPTPDAREAAKQEIADAYRKGVVESGRLLKAGGTKTATPVMKATMTGQYLKLQMQDVAPGVHSKGTVRNGVIVDGGFKTDTKTGELASAGLTGCEDLSKYKIIDDKSGKDVYQLDSRYIIQHMKAKRGSDGKWRISETTGTDPMPRDDWNRQPCVRSGDVR